jgi:DNA primase
MEYLFDLTFTKYNIQKIEEKKRAVYQILLYMNMLPDKIEQGHYLKELAEIIHEPEEILREMMSKKQIKARTPEKMLTEAVFKTNQREEAISDRLLALCLWEPNFFNYVIENLPTEMVPKPEAKSIYKQLIIYYTNRQADSLDQPVEFDYNEIKANLNHQEVKYLDGLLLLSEDAFLEEEFNFLEEELKNLTREAKKIAIVKALTEVQAKIQQAEKGQNLGALEDLSAEFNDLLEHLNELQHY